MKDFCSINKTITNWDGSFDELVKQLTPTDYATIFKNAPFFDLYVDSYEELYKKGVWAECLKLYLEYFLKECIDMRVKHRTDNLFRLWYETL